MCCARPGGSVRLRTILSSRTRAAPRKGTRSRPEIGAVVACWTRVITDLLNTQTVPLRASIESTKCRAEFHLLPPATGLTLGVSGHPLPLDKYNPDSLHGCRPAGELRSSRNSHGHGTGCIRAVARVSAILTLKIRSGRIVTDSSSRLAMPPHYYIPCCT